MAIDLTVRPILTAVVVVILAALYRLAQVGKRDSRLPPGPPTIPVLGNATHIPPRYAHLKFQEWSKQYGPVFSVLIFGQPMVVLNDARSVREILDRRSGSSSDRAPSHINNVLIANNNHILLANGTRSSLFRKLWNQTLSTTNVVAHVPLQNAEGIAVLYNTLQNPKDYYKEMRRYSASLTLSIAYGKRATTYDGVDASGFSVAEFYRLEHEFNFYLEVGAAPPIDIVPALKYLPEFMAPWKAQARKTRADMKRLYLETMFKEVKDKMKQGIRTGCWMEQIIERNDGLDDESLAWNGGVMMEGGSDTTSGALLTFILAAVLYPEAIAKAHKELDAVIGSERSPTLEDIDQLPYCQAVIYEVMRWRPTAPAGVPHLTTKDEIYEGMLIPKGTVIVGNTWAVLHDPASYDEPEKFNPDRFIKNKYGIRNDLAGEEDWRNTFPYGAGRRICLGMHLAEQSMKINIPKLLWAFKYAQATDPTTGEKIRVSQDDFAPGHLTAPLPFECEIKVRSEQIKETIEREYEEVRPQLKQYEVSIAV